MNKMNMASMELYRNQNSYLKRHAEIIGFKPIAEKEYSQKLLSIIMILRYYLPHIKTDYLKQLLNKNKSIKKLLQKGLLDLELTFGVHHKIIKDYGFFFDDILELMRQNKPVILHFKDDGNQCYKNATVCVIGVLDYGDFRFLEIYDGTSKIKYYLDYDKINPLSEIVY